MYSYEMKTFLDERDNIISKDEYYMLTDSRSNPQIINIKYDTYNGKYELVTEDGYYFSFNIRR